MLVLALLKDARILKEVLLKGVVTFPAQVASARVTWRLSEPH